MTELTEDARGDPVKSGSILSRVPVGHFDEVDDVVNLAVFPSVGTIAALTLWLCQSGVVRLCAYPVVWSIVRQSRAVEVSAS